MTTQPEALRLADLLETYPLNECDKEAAAELRRLHEELAVTVYQVELLSDDLSRCSKMNSELLEALSSVWLWMKNQADGQSKGGHATFDLMMLREQRDIARAAIAKAEGEQS